jgi:hypothetical protein
MSSTRCACASGISMCAVSRVWVPHLVLTRVMVLKAHPSAARMFAAVLQRADGAHTLLPLLLEPLKYTASALAGVSAELVMKCRADVRD